MSVLWKSPIRDVLFGIPNTTEEVEQGLCRTETEGKRCFFDGLGLLLGT